MFSDETLALGGGTTLALAIVVVAIYLMFNADNASAHIVAFFVIAVPLINNPYLPGQAFGIRGLSPVNLLTAIAFLAVLVKVSFTGKIYGYLVRFLTMPMTVCMLVFIVGASLTFFSGGEHAYYEGPAGVFTWKPSRIEFLLYECIRPLQIMLLGFLVMVVCDVNGDKRLIQRAILIAPIAMSLMALVFSLAAGLDNYKVARAELGVRMGLHGNTLGQLSVYFLIAAIIMREHAWPRMRYAAIAFAMLGIVLSFSRISMLTTVIMLPFLYQKLNARERLAVGFFIGSVIVLFAAQLVARITFGLADGTSAVDLNEISSGRTEEIWIPGILQFLEKPVFGYGIGMLVDSPTLGKIAPHSAYLTVLLETGLLGLLAIANLFYWAIRYCRRHGDETVFLLAAMLIMSFTGHAFTPGINNYVVWVFYGMLVHTKYRERGDVGIQSSEEVSEEIVHSPAQLIR